MKPKHFEYDGKTLVDIKSSLKNYGYAIDTKIIPKDYAIKFKYQMTIGTANVFVYNNIYLKLGNTLKESEDEV